MKGFLIINGFLESEKFNDIYSRLREAAGVLGIELLLFRNSDFQNSTDSPLMLPFRPDFVLFWDKDVFLAQAFERMEIPVFNSSRAIALCDDKAKMHYALSSLPSPKTVVAPMTFPNIGYTNTDFLKRTAEYLSFPIVVKECFGSFGAQVYLANNMEELERITKSHERVPLIFQKLVSESFGRDIRINVVGGRICAAMLRMNENGDFRSNITLGGTMLPYSPTDAECAFALSACEKLGLDFGGVDILFGNDGPLLCEVNSNAHFKSTYDATGINLADFIMEHIAGKVRGRS